LTMKPVCSRSFNFICGFSELMRLDGFKIQKS
jgi:hypothetical protein